MHAMRTTTLLFVLTIGFAARSWAQAPVDIQPGQNIQSIVNAHGPGTVYRLRAGIHREQSVVPQNGDRFEGEDGTVLSGARNLSASPWTWSSATCGGSECWYVSDQQQEGRVTLGGRNFNGSNDYIDLEGVPNVSQFTIAMFYTAASRPEGGTIDVLGTYGQQGEDDVEDPWGAFTPMLYVNPEGRVVGVNWEGSVIGVASDQPLEIGAQYHIALTCDGSVLRLWVNGALQGTSSPPVSANCPVSGFTDPVFRLGARVSFGDTQRVHGTLFDIAIWADDLDGGQIGQLSRRERFPDEFGTALVGYASLTRVPLARAELGGPLVLTGTEAVAATNCVLEPLWWPFDVYPRCNYPEDVWFDDVVKRHVASLAEVGAGTWHFDYEQNRIYVGENPSGHNVETSVTPHAFGGASGVALVDLVIERYAVPTQVGAAVNLGPQSQLVSSEVRDNHYAGVYNGPDSLSQETKVHRNGGFGFIGAGEDIRIIANEISFNNTAGYNPFWGAGGSKWVWTINLEVSGNYVHDNDGPGLWTDIENFGCLYDGNWVVDNKRQGIFHEISYDCVIRNNFLGGNGIDWVSTGQCHSYSFLPPGYIEGAGIQVDASPRVLIENNSLLDNCHGIGAVQVPRGGGTRGLFEIEDLHVRGNTVTMSSGVNGLQAPDASYFTTRRNRWENNDYYFAGPVSQTSFRWDGTDLTFAAWQGQCQWLSETEYQCQDVGGEVHPR
jgi:hypothetical protein